MTSVSAIQISQKIRELQLKFITLENMYSLLKTTEKNSLYKALQRLEKHGVIRRLDKGKYEADGTNPSEFEIANFLVQPSYVSLESALSFYGILPQFPYMTTSITTKRSRKIKSNNKEFEYVTLNANLFWGYVKNSQFIIATPEKAVIDYLYLASMGLRNPDYSEWDRSQINTKLLLKLSSRIIYKPFSKIMSQYA